MKRTLKLLALLAAGAALAAWLFRYLQGRRLPETHPWPEDEPEHSEPPAAPPRATAPATAPVPPAASTPAWMAPQAVDEEAMLLDALEETVGEDPTPRPPAGPQVEEGNSFFNAGDYEKAAECYTRALEAEPALVSAWYNRANAHTRAGNYDTALADYDRAIGLSHDDPDALNNRGMLHLYRSDYTAALADFSAALALNPADTTVLVNRGLAHLHGGEASAALKDFIDAGTAAPNDAAAHYGAGQAASMLGDIPAALDHVGRALELDPAYAREAAADSKLASLQANEAFLSLLRAAGAPAE